MSISQNSALFALIGTYYGGNGTTNFALPNFQGCVPVGAGTSPISGTVYNLGEVGGTESVTLLTQQMPSHTHTSSFTLTLAIAANNTQATDSVPTATVNTLAAPYDTGNLAPIAGYNNAAPNTALNVGTGSSVTGQIGLTGNNLPHENRQPYTCVNYIIALNGIFPSRG